MCTFQCKVPINKERNYGHPFSWLLDIRRGNTATRLVGFLIYISLRIHFGSRPSWHSCRSPNEHRASITLRSQLQMSPKRRPPWLPDENVFLAPPRRRQFMIMRPPQRRCHSEPRKGPSYGNIEQPARSPSAPPRVRTVTTQKVPMAKDLCERSLLE